MWESRQLLQQMGPHHRGMAAGAAGQDLDLLNPRVEGIIHRQRHRLIRRQSLGQMARHPQLCVSGCSWISLSMK